MNLSDPQYASEVTVHVPRAHVGQVIGTSVHPYDRKVTEQELLSMKAELLQAKLKDRQPKTWREHLSTVFSFAYVKELAPSIVLAIVAILALTASAKAQQQINDVNTSLVSSKSDLQTVQLQLLKLQGDYEKVQEDYQQLILAAAIQLQTHNQTVFDLTALNNQIVGEYQQATTVLNTIRSINDSYPYPWTVAAQINSLQSSVISLQLTHPTNVSSLPSNPHDGQEVYFQTPDMAQSGVIWHLRYRASSTSPAYPWEFVGGGWLTASGGPQCNIAPSFSWSSCSASASITFPLAGDYDGSQGGKASVDNTGCASNPGNCYYYSHVNFSSIPWDSHASDKSAIQFWNNAGGISITGSTTFSVKGVLANSTATVQFESQINQGWFSDTWLWVRPLRVG